LGAQVFNKNPTKSHHNFNTNVTYTAKKYSC